MRSQRSLVLIAATAGYGKTTALTQALEALSERTPGTAIAWVGCDEGDTPLQLFSCLVAALEPFDLPWRSSPDSLIAAALASDDMAARQKSLRHMVAELINALDAADVPQGVIAVDDLHRIDHPALFLFLDLLLERFTPRWTGSPRARHRRSRWRGCVRAATSPSSTPPTCVSTRRRRAS